MKNQYNQFHNYQLDTSDIIQKISFDNLMLKYESKNIMDALFKGVNHRGYYPPSYISQFFVLPRNDKSDEQMFTYKIYNDWGDEVATRNVKESFLLYLSPSNQLVDATLLRNEEMKETLKEYGTFAWLVDTQGKDDDDYTLALNINNNYDKDLCWIDICPLENGSYTLEKYGVSFFVSELHEIEKLLSIFYGSVFSLKFERVFVKWVRYEVTIPRLKVANILELKETVRTLKYLLEKVDKQVNLD